VLHSWDSSRVTKINEGGRRKRLVGHSSCSSVRAHGRRRGCKVYLGQHQDAAIVESGLGTQEVMAVGVINGIEELDLILALLDEIGIGSSQKSLAGNHL